MTTTPTISGVAESGDTPVAATTVMAHIAPIMKISPCAKLISSMMPYTRV